MAIKTVEQLRLELELAQSQIKNLKDQQSAIKSAVEQTLEGIQIIDNHFRYVYLNEAAAAHGRAQSADLIGKTMMECYPGIDNSDFFKILVQVMKTGIQTQIENHFVYPNGTKCWFELFIEPHTIGVLIRSVDITSRKLLEDKLLHSQKLEAIGQLAGGIAHDFNNKLGIMTVYCEMAAELTADNPKLSGYLKQTLGAIRQSAMLTRQLLAFGRKQVFDLKTVNLNSWLEDFQKNSLPKLVGENIKINYFHAEKLGNARVDLSQMDQILLNLCLNARDAMPNGGTITIETQNAVLDEAYCKTHTDVTPGNYVMLSVSDTGGGIAPEILGKIFEPFFTTKGVGKSSGLGLSMVHGIVKQSRGHIWVYSEVGHGTVFKLYFPRTDISVDDTIPVSIDESRLKGSERVLLVEDEDNLRLAFEESLSEAGYKVTSAGNFEDGVRAFEANKGEIDLLLTDIVLPTANGRDLANALKKKKPNLKVIFVSGYTENSIVHHAVLDTDSVLVQKPVSIRTLLFTLRRVLEGELSKGVV